jgi:hypothetical protein
MKKSYLIKEKWFLERKIVISDIAKVVYATRKVVILNKEKLVFAERNEVIFDTEKCSSRKGGIGT